MNWNHRIVRTPDSSYPEFSDNEYVLQFAEVYYDEAGNPEGYGRPFLHSETLEGMIELADRLTSACQRPIIDFPAEE